jgi:hypothetical protein
MILGVATLVLGSALATAALAQNAGRNPNDGGMIAEPQSQPTVPQYNNTGAVVAAPGGAETGTSSCARFHSFDPTTNTYIGKGGQRRPCP